MNKQSHGTHIAPFTALHACARCLDQNKYLTKFKTKQGHTLVIFFGIDKT